MINPTKQKIYQALEDVIDLELGIDVVNLGLIYEVNINEENECGIVMTMPSKGETIASTTVQTIKRTVERKVKDLAAIKVEIVWNPPWTMERMSPYARLELDL
ncbi:metal-sulfur cluster assembly factor [Cytobacillus sp. FJAT-54145]|uniref:Metal-sulfur cluster assembly factor n=1 Tax=Cytobacillus spartinae TaxID=3299023 RepID=A0ABW6KC93_9BACI